MQPIRARHQHQSNHLVRCPTILIISLLFVAAYYVYSYQTQEYCKEHKLAIKKCTSQLANVKYQLDSVSEYKKKMDQLLIEIQKECNIEKDNVKQYMDNYLSVKHYLQNCETHTDELELQCTELKEKLHNTNNELETCRKLQPRG